ADTPQSVGLGNPQAELRDDEHRRGIRLRSAEDILIGRNRACQPGRKCQTQHFAQPAEHPHPTLPCDCSTSPLWYCSNATRSPNRARYSSSSTGDIRCSFDLMSEICRPTRPFWTAASTLETYRTVSPSLVCRGSTASSDSRERAVESIVFSAAASSSAGPAKPALAPPAAITALCTVRYAGWVNASAGNASYSGPATAGCCSAALSVSRCARNRTSAGSGCSRPASSIPVVEVRGCLPALPAVGRGPAPVELSRTRRTTMSSSCQPAHHASFAA